MKQEQEQTKKGGLRNGSGKKKVGTLLRHIPVLDIYGDACHVPYRVRVPGVIDKEI